MSNNIFVITEHLKGQVDDVSYEMLGKAKELAASYGGQVIAVLLGSGAKSLADDFAADKVLYADHPQLAEFNPEGYCKTIAGLVNSHEPKAVLVAYSSQGVDIAAALSVECDLPLVAYVSNLNAESITSQLYGGKMSVESKVEGERYIAAVLPGAFPADAGKGGGATVEEVAVPELDGLKVGVSVTRAYGFPPDDPYTVAQAEALLTDKLGDIPLSTANVAPEDQWIKQILHVIAYGPQHAEALRMVEGLVDPAVRGDTILWISVTNGDDAFIYE